MSAEPLFPGLPWMEAPAPEFLEAVARLDEDSQIDALWLRFEWDRPLFMAHCFPDLITLAYSQGHAAIFELLGAIPAFHERVGTPEFASRQWNYGIEAPRGMAKTTIAKLSLVHDVVYGREPHLLWLGPNQTEVYKEARHIKGIFTSPGPEFSELYGPFTVTGNLGDLDIQVGTDRPVRLTSRSAPKGTVRGANANGQRPTRAYGDDIERPKDVLNAQLRDELSQWLASDVRNAGPKEGGLVLWHQGTRLHPDSQTARNAKDPAFTSIRLQSIKSWPKRMDLWNQCRELWADLGNPDREIEARVFYEEHQAEMDEGAEVLDPVAAPIYRLMVLLWSIGRRAFAKDQQNEPSLGDDATFDLTRARRFRFDGEHLVHLHRDEAGRRTEGRRVPLRDCQLAIFLDPRNSEAVNRNDFASIAVVARDSFGYRYVVTVDMARDKPSGGRARMWAMLDRFGPGALYEYEDNGAQVLHGESFEREMTERRNGGQQWRMGPLHGVTSTVNKDDDIARLQPDVENGWLLFEEGLSLEFWEQLEQHPNAAHDDGPDSVAKACRLLENTNHNRAGYGRMRG